MERLLAAVVMALRAKEVNMVPKLSGFKDTSSIL
jgi:hypothetical protein